jgi:thymidine kinase
MTYNPHLKPGCLEVICGPMFCGKTQALIAHLERLEYMRKHGPTVCYKLIKPQLDNRTPHVTSRHSGHTRDAYKIDEKNPQSILECVNEGDNLVAIDEAQFFDDGLVEVCHTLQRRGHHVLIAGLDLDFRGEPFGQMPNILSVADEVHKLTAICQYDKCGGRATRTQRLINGQPAPYDSPLVLIGDKESYEARCLQHHFVPGKPVHAPPVHAVTRT